MEAIYARQSLDKKDSLSIESQIELCRKQASEEVTIYQDKGFSGKDTNRPAFEALMADVQRGTVTKILVYRLDRFSRSIADFGRVWELLERHAVAFESVSEKFDTATPMGRAMLNIIMTFAQLERETIAERVKVNYYHRHSLGAWPGGPPPMGYDIGRLKGDNGRAIPTLVSNEQMDVVKDLFRRYATSDSSLGEIARQLNQEGIGGTRRANWDTVRVARILKNPVYVMADEAVYWYYKGKGLEIAQPVEAFTGVHACNLVGKREGKTRKHQSSSQKLALSNHVGCIHADLFLQCQYKLDHNQPLDRTSAGRHSWLTGLMKCKSCGYAVKLNRQQDKVFLLCSGRSNLQICDERFSMDIRTLEQSVREEMERLLKTCPPEQLKAVEQDRFTDTVQAIDLKIERLLAALSEGGDVSARYINREIERLDQERGALKAEREAARVRRRANDLAELQFTALSFEEKKIVAACFIEKILLTGDTAEVVWRL